MSACRSRLRSANTSLPSGSTSTPEGWPSSATITITRWKCPAPSCSILAIAHRQFIERGADGIRALGTPGAVLFDVKKALPRAHVDGCL
jgi:hypothetical protein